MRSGVSRPAVAVVLALFLGACQATPTVSPSPTGDAAAEVSLLFSQTATGGTLLRSGSGDAYTLTLTGIDDHTIEFADRPSRYVGVITTAEFIDNWTESFGADPPNAALVEHERDTGAPNSLVITLSDPTYDAALATLTYRVTLLADEDEAGRLAGVGKARHLDPPTSFTAVSLFIDSVSAQVGVAEACTEQGSPATPVRMTVVNQSGFPDSEVYVALTGGSLEGYESWDANPRDLINTSVRLSCLPTDERDPSGHTRYFELGEGIGAGLLWISLGSPITSKLPDVQPSFDTTTYRFANVEFAYPGQGDMTNVDQFSFPIKLEALSKSGAKVTADYSANTCTIVDALKQAVDTYNASARAEARADWRQIVVRDAKGNFVRVLSPKQRAKQLARNGQTANPFAQGWPTLVPYIQSLAGRELTVKGLFTPGAKSAHADQTGWYSYTGSLKDGVFTFNGTIGAAIEAGPGGTGAVTGSEVTIEVSGTDTVAGGAVVGVDGLASGVYDQNSRYSVGGAARNGLTDGTAEPAAPNDVYNSIYRDFVTAFTYGYWGGVYGDDNSAFWNSFAPPAAPSGGKPAFAAARPSNDGDFLPYNLYSKVMFDYSDNYNIPYGEDYGSGAPGRPSPLLDIPVGGEWRMTIQPDGPDGCLD
ncbi:MAG TPA: beta-1,3-glucanase family protein [Candidatus Limnocylindria bacterium]|jgi:hypothetical protein|nr:beta-1,3-glucanase family protein [Candidatus Limnocylindria bacterium]